VWVVGVKTRGENWSAAFPESGEVLKMVQKNKKRQG
jgi:hypothetical protein